MKRRLDGETEVQHASSPTRLARIAAHQAWAEPSNQAARIAPNRLLSALDCRGDEPGSSRPRVTAV
ncbi:MAG: hypothetical protein IPK72_03000 [Candidatus Eisenbacteria bacterium]|nr:hypothetical protein [Candidatus Eisenbacteria bacterium]